MFAATIVDSEGDPNTTSSKALKVVINAIGDIFMLEVTILLTIVVIYWFEFTNGWVKKLKTIWFQIFGWIFKLNIYVLVKSCIINEYAVFSQLKLN